MPGTKREPPSPAAPSRCSGAVRHLPPPPPGLRPPPPPRHPAAGRPHRRPLLRTHSNKEDADLENGAFFLLLFIFCHHPPPPHPPSPHPPDQKNISTFLFCSLSQNHKIKTLMEVTKGVVVVPPPHPPPPRPSLLRYFSTVVSCSQNHPGTCSVFGFVSEEKAELFENPIRTHRKRRSFQKVCFGFCLTGIVHVGIWLCRT